MRLTEQHFRGCLHPPRASETRIEQQHLSNQLTGVSGAPCQTRQCLVVLEVFCDPEISDDELIRMGAKAARRRGVRSSNAGGVSETPLTR